MADVALDVRSVGADALYTYHANESSRVGQIVHVPLGTRSCLGVVINVRTVIAEELGFPERMLRAVGPSVEGLDLPEPSLDLARFIARRTLCALPVAVGAAIPPGVRERLVTRWRVIEGADATSLSPALKETLRAMVDDGGVVTSSKSNPLDASAKKSLRSLRDEGFVAESLGIAPTSETHRLPKSLRLTSDEGSIELFLKKQGKKKPAQALLLMRLQGAGEATFSPQELKALSGTTDQTIKGLLVAKLLEESESDAPAPRPAPKPNPRQSEAIDAIVAAIKSDTYKPFLLYGVTGSGKTEVYLRAASEALRLGKQVLYLVPEITLTAQVIAQLRERFGQRVAVLHSNLSPQERLRNWMRVASGDAPVVLGPRSALFAPFTRLGLVIVDEEHEASYKQESSPRYHARDAAKFLAERCGAPIVLGSATPSIESFFEAQEGRLTLLRLPERAASARLPKVFVQDLTEGYKAGKPELISTPLKEKVLAAIERGEQAILFLNRRAFSPFLLCRECGRRFFCASCSVALAFHRREALLKCHHCGHTQKAPDTCPDCGGSKIAPFGAGAERIEDLVRHEFEGITVARLDRDVARVKGALESTLAEFRSGATQVLVGTQMVAKGLDFPNVTVVGVIAADLSLNIPDFRAAERTFQLLSQVAGRAGRGVAHGEVVIQTMSPDHLAVVCAQEHDFERLYASLVVERREALYPPFCQIINIVLSGENRPMVVKASQEVRNALAAAHPMPPIASEERLPILLGPVDCPLERLQGSWRRHVVLKLAPDADVRTVSQALEEIDLGSVHMVIDVDPYSMM